MRVVRSLARIVLLREKLWFRRSRLTNQGNRSGGRRKDKNLAASRDPVQAGARREPRKRCLYCPEEEKESREGRNFTPPDVFFLFPLRLPSPPLL